MRKKETETEIDRERERETISRLIPEVANIAFAFFVKYYFHL